MTALSDFESYKQSILDKIKELGSAKASRILKDSGIKASPQYLSQICTGTKRFSYEQALRLGQILLKKRG